MVGRVHQSLPALAAILSCLEKQTDSLWEYINDSFFREGVWEGRSLVVIIQLGPCGLEDLGGAPWSKDLG